MVPDGLDKADLNGDIHVDIGFARASSLPKIGNLNVAKATGHKELNIALLELSQEVELGSDVSPICLPPNPSKEETFTDMDCRIVSQQKPWPAVSVAKDKLECNSNPSSGLPPHSV